MLKGTAHSPAENAARRERELCDTLLTLGFVPRVGNSRVTSSNRQKPRSSGKVARNSYIGCSKKTDGDYKDFGQDEAVVLTPNESNRARKRRMRLEGKGIAS